MANSLINGTEPGETPASAAPAETFPTFGYHKDGRAQIFNLKPGEKLPKGWADKPFEPKADVAPDPTPEPETNDDGS